MVNINLFAGPGTGKSTTAAGVFFEMKRSGMSVEYVTEYAKSLVFSKDHFRIKDQVYMLAKQHHNQFRLEGQVDYAVHDSPFIMGLMYLQDNPHLPEKEFYDLVIAMHKSYDNINIFLERDNDAHPYQEYGRYQTLSEAEELDRRIKSMLDDHIPEYYTVKVSHRTHLDIIDIINRHERKDG